MVTNATTTGKGGLLLALGLILACHGAAWAQSPGAGKAAKSVVTSNPIKEFTGTTNDLVDFEIDLRVGYTGSGAAPTFISEFSLKVKPPQAQLYAIEAGTEVSCPGLKDAYSGTTQTDLAGQSSGSYRQISCTAG